MAGRKNTPEEAAIARAKRLARHRAYHKKHRAKTGERLRAEDKARRATPEARATSRTWYEKNKERRAAYMKKWRADNSDRVQASFLEWSEINRQHRRAYMKQWAINHADGRQAYMRAMTASGYYRKAYAENPRHAARLKAWRKANPEKCRAYIRISSERRRGATGVCTALDVAALMLLQRGRCAYCRMSLKLKFENDHIMPIALGGTNERKNRQLLCPPCNRRKSAANPIVFAQRLGLLL